MPTLLHTPLMSGTNAIHGIVIVGAIIVAGHAAPRPVHADPSSFIAVVLASANVVGGFVVTDRMLEMFKKRPDERASEHEPTREPAATWSRSSAFILALRFLSSPRHARLGELDRRRRDARGRSIVTLSLERVVTGYWWIGGRDGDRRGDRVVGARKVKMTAMPQMVALFNGVGGGAAALVSLAEFHSRLGPSRATSASSAASRRVALGADRRRSRSPAR